MSENCRKVVTEFPPRAVALSIAGHDFEMVSNIIKEDVLRFIPPPSSGNLLSKSTSLPKGVQPSLDFALFVTRLVQSTSVTADSSSGRSRILSHWIEVATRLNELRDHHGLLAVVSGLTSVPIMRLQRSWTLVPRKLSAQMTDLSSIFTNYKATLSKTPTPFVPAIEILLLREDATFSWDIIEKTVKIPGFDMEIKERSPLVSHWILSQIWMSEGDVEKNII
jgi:hypothetical protein